MAKLGELVKSTDALLTEQDSIVLMSNDQGELRAMTAVPTDVDRVIEVDARPGHADEPVGESLRLCGGKLGLLRRPLQARTSASFSVHKPSSWKSWCWAAILRSQSCAVCTQRAGHP